MRSVVLCAVALGVVFGSGLALGQEEESPHQKHLRALAADFLGEWVNESETDRDLPGVWKKGDKLVAHLKYEWAVEGALLEVNWWGEVNGKPAPAKAKALVGWDSSTKQVAGNWFSTVGERGKFAFTKAGDKWMFYASSVLAGGEKASQVATDEFAKDGKTFISRLTHRTIDGKALPDKVNTWKRKRQAEKPSNHSQLKEWGELVVGRWVSDITLIADWQGQSKKQGEKLIGHQSVKWIVDKMGIEEESFAGDTTGKTIYAWDAAAKQIKFFNVGSGGGFFEGTLMKKDKKWAWKLEGSLPDGTKMKGTGTWTAKDGGNTLILGGSVFLGGERLPGLHDVYKRVNK